MPKTSISHQIADIMQGTSLPFCPIIYYVFKIIVQKSKKWLYIIVVICVGEFSQEPIGGGILTSVACVGPLSHKFRFTPYNQWKS